MPPKSVPKTIGDFILYYYAKLVIAPSAGQDKNYNFIIDRYKRLKKGEIKISDYDREIQKNAQQSGICAFCMKKCKTIPTEIIPRSLGGPIGIQNLVHACQECAASKGDKDLFVWWCDHMGRKKEDLPRIPAALFLKMAYERHMIAFSLTKRCNDIRDIWFGAKT